MRLFIIVAVVLASFGLACGQGFSVGANLGGSYNMWNFDVTDWPTYSGIGFGGGVVFDVSLLPMLGLEMDVLYAMYKYSATLDFSGIDVDQTITMNNLVIPFLVKYKMAMPAVSPCIAAGPAIIRNLSGTIETSSGGASSSVDVPDDLLETDFAIQAGAGANVAMMPGMGVAPYARFQYNVTADDPDSPNNSESMYDILFGVNFTYKIK